MVMAYLVFESSKGRKDLIFVTLSQEQAFSCCELWSEQVPSFIYRVYEVKEGVESFYIDKLIPLRVYRKGLSF